MMYEEVTLKNGQLSMEAAGTIQRVGNLCGNECIENGLVYVVYQ